MKTNIGFFIFLLIIYLPIKVYGSSESVLIVFSGEETGNLEPCGCYKGQIGGIPRRDTCIDSFRKNKNVVLPVSLGDLPKSIGRQDEIKMEIFCRAFGEMDYILHNLGEKDIEIGPQLLNYLSHTSKTPFLSSNLQLVDSFPAKIHKYILKECLVSGRILKIAFLGILSKSLLNNSVLEYINVEDPVHALKPLVKQLQEQANLIVLLSHAPLAESIEIAKYFPEVGLIITGHNVEEPVDSITYIKNTPIVSSGREGKYIGIAKYSVNNAVMERKSVVVVPLDNKHKDSQEMISLLKEYQQMLADEDLLSKVSQAPLLNGLSYVGSSACGMCHKVVYEHWNKTTHGSSYSTLVKKGYQYDPECIKCHTTGYGGVSGFLNFEKYNNLINVGCESCHGAGSRHINNITEAYGLTNESNCMVCHDSEHSPIFQFEEYWRKIAHPEETLKKLPKTIE